MDTLFEKFHLKYALTKTHFIRGDYHSIDWSNRLIGIKGSRGVGKTTLILQYLKKNFNPNGKILYVSLDDLYFSTHRLYDLAKKFYQKGGQLLAIDEVHLYKNWSIEIKNIYDDFPDLKIIFTGSSLLHLHKSKADLSRRAVIYHMQGLSFREFLFFELKKSYSPIPLDTLLHHATELSVNFLKDFKPLEQFDKYLTYGYYPFYKENIKSFNIKLEEIIHTVLEIDIPQFANIQTSHIIYLKKLLTIISESVPFKPNLRTLSNRTGISINTLKEYIHLLHQANLIQLVHTEKKGVNTLNKPEKIYLENPNLIFALTHQADKGNLRETFFLNQLKNKHQVNSSEYADFLIDNQYTFEIGGKNKTRKQINALSDAYLVKDDIETGTGQTIPLWLFGFLY